MSHHICLVCYPNDGGKQGYPNRAPKANRREQQSQTKDKHGNRQFPVSVVKGYDHTSDPSGEGYQGHKGSVLTVRLTQKLSDGLGGDGGAHGALTNSRDARTDGAEDVRCSALVSPRHCFFLNITAWPLSGSPR
ncbi:MAG: hypothetical protein ACKPGI_18450, partial [Verrucomicrobiota bacterium]